MPVDGHQAYGMALAMPPNQGEFFSLYASEFGASTELYDVPEFGDIAAPPPNSGEQQSYAPYFARLN